jgi:membrane-associated phospholipid phosphatase
VTVVSPAVRTVPSKVAALQRWVVPALVGGLLMLTLAVDVGWWPVSLDHRVAAALPGRHATGVAPVLLALASAVTTLATPQASVLITLMGAALLSWRDASLSALTSVVVPLGALSVTVLAGKALLHRPGPPGSQVHHLFGYYPSGHTTTAVVCTGLLMRLVGDGCAASRSRLRAVATTWVVLVGSSLVFHRYHWLTDVLAGLMLGSLIVRLTRPGQQDAFLQSTLCSARAAVRRTATSPL